MTETGQLLAGIALELLLIGAACWRWLRRADDGYPFTWAGRLTMIAAATGGLAGAPFWWMDLPAAFSWDLPFLASRLLAVAALAFGVAGVLVLERPSRARSQLYLLLVAVYLIPLALAAVFLHLDRFDFAKPITPVFFALVIAMPAGASWELIADRSRPAFDRTIGTFASTYLRLSGTALGIWGLALFLVPVANIPWLFVWPADPLTSRLIAAMLLTLSTAMLTSWRDSSRTKLTLVMAAIYGIGIAVAVLLNAATGRPAPLFYAGALGLVGIGAIFGMASLATVRKKAAIAG